MKRIKKRKKRNRYDKFDKKFYNRAQRAFINIAKQNKKRYLILDNSKDNSDINNKIFYRFLKLLNA